MSWSPHQTQDRVRRASGLVMCADNLEVAWNLRLQGRDCVRNELNVWTPAGVAEQLGAAGKTHTMELLSGSHLVSKQIPDVSPFPLVWLSDGHTGCFKEPVLEFISSPVSPFTSLNSAFVLMKPLSSGVFRSAAVPPQLPGLHAPHPLRFSSSAQQAPVFFLSSGFRCSYTGAHFF